MDCVNSFSPKNSFTRRDETNDWITDSMKNLITQWNKLFR